MECKYQIQLQEGDTIHVSLGNLKIGKICNFNTLPAVQPIFIKGQQLVNVCGTCGAVDCSECARKCYAVHAAQRNHTRCVVPWAKNTLLIRKDLKAVENQLNGFILYKAAKLFRFHSSGEIETVEQFAMYCRVARKNKGTAFCIYTKAFGLLSEYIQQEGRIPSNFIVSLSEWHGNIARFLETQPDNVRKAFKVMNVFSYYDGAKECIQDKKFVFCPAVNEKHQETGITCDKCQRCYKKGNKTRVYPH